MIVRVIGAFIAIYAFAIVLETPKKYLWCAGTVSAVGWFVYLLSQQLGTDEVMATFLSATAISIVSHVFARVFRAPVTVFLVAGILPTVPGAGMYRIAASFIAGDSGMAAQNLITTLELAGVIAMGIFLVDAIFRLFQRGWKQNSMRYEKNE
jgi:uncharacterized membrane protein YjjB (DUF3815 family)